MTKAEYIALCSQRWDELEDLKKADSLYDYEEGYVNLWESLGQELFAQLLEPKTKDRRKKKFSSEGMDK